MTRSKILVSIVGSATTAMNGAGLKKAVIALPVAWTGVWLTYYGKSKYCLRNSFADELQRTLTRFVDRTFVNVINGYSRH